jgi:hypothetical protein
MMQALAEATDVAAVLGRPLTIDEVRRVDAILQKASELFRRAARQDFTSDESTSRLKVNGGIVVLPQRPVTGITSVVDDTGIDVPYIQQAGRLQVFDPGCPSLPLGSDAFVNVTYSHGGTVPDLVRLTVAEVAKKVLSIDPQAASGATNGSHTAGPFSESLTYANWAQGGQTMLAPDDLAIARSYRVRVPTVWVQQP